ncbi:DUF2550 family protein [Cellulomonas endophytica]|uniref:DUF2550 family protein n=1 Tax=Cellulomonas endophytica TaxID=2494735 RepID=UPI0010132AAF|nr:DUF2550 family protein [Cellulomonas endophytica]
MTDHLPLALALAALALLLALVLTWRRTSGAARRTGAFGCAVGRTPTGPWTAGSAVYSTAALTWTPGLLGVGRQRLVLPRRRMRVTDRTVVTAHGVQLLVVTCAVGDRTVLLRMSPEAYAGLTSWLEATTTGVNVVT